MYLASLFYLCPFGPAIVPSCNLWFGLPGRLHYTRVSKTPILGLCHGASKVQFRWFHLLITVSEQVRNEARQEPIIHQPHNLPICPSLHYLTISVFIADAKENVSNHYLPEDLSHTQEI